MVASVRGRVPALPRSAQCRVPLRNLLTCSDASNLSYSERGQIDFTKRTFLQAHYRTQFSLSRLKRLQEYPSEVKDEKCPLQKLLGFLWARH